MARQFRGAVPEQKKVFGWPPRVFGKAFSFNALLSYPQNSVFAASACPQQRLCRAPESGSYAWFLCLSVEMCRVVWCPQRQADTTSTELR
jgi:hypothetical protein